MQLIQSIDAHAINLWKKYVKVNYSKHIGGGVYVSVTSPYKCVEYESSSCLMVQTSTLTTRCRQNKALA